MNSVAHHTKRVNTLAAKRAANPPQLPTTGVAKTEVVLPVAISIHCDACGRFLTSVIAPPADPTEPYRAQFAEPSACFCTMRDAPLAAIMTAENPSETAFVRYRTHLVLGLVGLGYNVTVAKGAADLAFDYLCLRRVRLLEMLERRGSFMARLFERAPDGVSVYAGPTSASRG